MADSWKWIWAGFVLTLAPAARARAGAEWHGEARVGSDLFDSRWREGLVLEPFADLRLLARRGEWEVAGRGSLFSRRNDLGQNEFMGEWDEVLFRRRGPCWALAGGRQWLNAPSSLNLPLAPRRFLFEPWRVDGASGTWQSAGGEASLFLGTPRVVAASVLVRAGEFTFSALYRGERDAYFRLTPEGTNQAVQRSAHLHAWEFSTEYSTPMYSLTGIFQGNQTGAQRLPGGSAPEYGAIQSGPIDDSLPRSSADYRALTSFLWWFPSESAERTALGFALGGRSMPRYDVRNLAGGRAGVESEMQISTFVREEGDFTRAELGLAYDKAARNRYRFFSRRKNGQWELRTDRLSAWASAGMSF